jgi:hypothetical protein
VPLGTPLTITVDGFWDGDHNGNQPVIVVPNGQGENKKFHLPHGARVHTRPNVVEAVAFTVDKRPLCTAWDGRVRCDRESGHHPEPHRKWLGDSDVYYWYDEPLDDQRTATNDQIGSSDAPPQPGEPLGEFGEPLAQWEKDLLAEEPDDTPPQPGDTVSVKLSDENGSVVVGKYDHRHEDGFHRILNTGEGKQETFMLVVPPGADIQVIARARPAVPEEPYRDVITYCLADGTQEHWTHLAGTYSSELDISLSWRDLCERAQDEGWTIHEVQEVTRYERGPEIGA